MFCSAREGEIRRKLVHQRGLGTVLLFARGGRGLRPGRSGGHVVFLQHTPGLSPDLLLVDAQFAQRFDGGAFRQAGQAEQDVLGADVMVVEPARLFDGELQHLLGAGSQFDMPAVIIARSTDAFHHFAYPIQFQAEIAQDASGDAPFFF